VVAVAVGVALVVAVGVAVAVAVPVDVGVAVAVDVGVEVTVDVAVGVAVDVGVGLAVGVGVGVPATCTSNEPMSMRPLTTRSKPGPRWSKLGGGTNAGSPASMAGLPGKSACVKVGPPLSCRGPSTGSVLIRSPVPVRTPPPSSLLRL
jgi:hypothetical protein